MVDSGAWGGSHKAWHVMDDAWREDSNAGGVLQQRNREAAERSARFAESTGSEYIRLLAEGSRHLADENFHKADSARPSLSSPASPRPTTTSGQLSPARDASRRRRRSASRPRRDT